MLYLSRAFLWRLGDSVSLDEGALLWPQIPLVR